MMGKIFAPIALALLLGALPAQAAHRSHEQRDTKAAELAQRLERAVHQVYREAVESRRHHSFRQWQAIFALRQLDQRADRFERLVEREGIHDRDTLRAFRRLEEAFAVAEARLPALRRVNGLARDLQGAEHLMQRLDQRVAQADRSSPRCARRADGRHGPVVAFGRRAR